MTAFLFPALVFSGALAAAFGAGFFLSKRLRRSQADRLLGLLVWPFGLTAAALFFYKMKWAVFYDENWMRLERILVLAKGLPLYYGLQEGPIFTNIYGPVSALLYLPAALFPDAPSVMAAAGGLSIVFFFGPVLWLHLGRVPGAQAQPALAVRLCAFFCLCMIPFFVSSLRISAFTVHADAPMLGLAALACGFIYFREDKNSWRNLIFCSIFSVLAVWSKQVAVGLMAALPVYLFLTEGPRSAARLILTHLVCGLVISGAIVAVFGLEDMLLNVLTVPRLHPWKGDSGLLGKALFKLVRESLIMLGIYAASLRPRFVRSGLPFSDWLRRERWSIFITAALFMAPFSILGFVKVGGSNNVFSLAAYFLLIPATLGFLWQPGEPSKWKLAGLSALLLLIQIPIVSYRIAATPGRPNHALHAYRYALKHPHQAYFPRLTGVSVLAEGGVYHDTVALLDRQWAGLEVSKEHLWAHVPKDLRLIAFAEGEDDDMYLLAPIPVGAVTRDPELPGFRIYPVIKKETA